MSFGLGHVSKADATAYSSSDSDENEDDDFHQDARGEFHDFNPRKRRRTGQDAKESAALGIFGSDSEEDGPGRRWKSKQNLRHKNMAFVSSGQHRLDEEDQGYEEEPADQSREKGLDVPETRAGLGIHPTQRDDGNADDDDDDDDDAEDDEEQENGRPGAGLGFRSSAPGSSDWTSRSSGGLATNTPSKPGPGTNYDGSTPLGRGFVPSSATEPVLRTDLEDAASSTPATPKPSAFGGGKAKSFAARMMAKMGYVEGQGLGAQGQGRNIIIEANLRPQGVGLGAVQEKSEQERKEEKRQRRNRGEEVSDSEEEKMKKKKKRERRKHEQDSGTTSGTSTPRRPKTKFLTVSDVQKAAPGLHIPDAFAPILDMTGPGQKLLTSSSGLLTPTTGAEIAGQAEAQKLARRAQGDLAAFVEEWKSLEERRAWLEMGTHQHKQELDEAESSYSKLQTFSTVLDGVYKAAGTREWDPVIAGLREAEAAGSTQDEELAAIAVAAIHPFLNDAVQGWQPLQDPKLGNFSSDLSDIQGLLGLQSQYFNNSDLIRREGLEIDGSHRHHQRSTTPYESMIYKLIFPKLVTAISQVWEVRDAAPLLLVFERWDLLFPTFVRSQLLEQVVRRLEETISGWKPKKKQHSLPHLWLFPWLQHLPPHHLDPKGTGLVADVRRKFRQLIDSWEFDRGVIPDLKQWKEIFRPSKEQDQWKPLVMHHVLPSMAKYLRTNFRVDPSDQEPYLPMLSGILKWTDVISTSMVGEVLVAEVFPMWHDVLHQWLVSDEANYEEVGTWFEWWHTQVFPSDISALPSIAAEFDKGTTMIEKALELGDEAKTRLQKPVRTPAHQPSKSLGKPKAQSNAPSTTKPTKPAEPQERTFRDELDEWCLENDLQFIPIHRANEEGRHYYRVTARMDGKGGVLAYFKNDVLFVESRKINFTLRRDKPEDRGILLDTLLGELD